MALVIGLWHFPAGETPSTGPIAQRLAEATGLPCLAEPPPLGDIDIPALRERLFDWRLQADGLHLCGFAPAHPYLWENLDRVLTGMGGQRGDDPRFWTPSPRRAGLRRQWSELSARDRLLLRLPPLGLSRPFDRLLSVSRQPRA